MHFLQHLSLGFLLLVAGSRAQDSLSEDQESLEEDASTGVVHQNQDATTLNAFITTPTTKCPTTNIFDRFRTKSPTTTTTTRSAVELFTLMRKSTISTTTEIALTTLAQPVGLVGTTATATGATITTTNATATGGRATHDVLPSGTVNAVASTPSLGEAKATNGNATKLANANATSTTKRPKVIPTKQHTLLAGLNVKNPSKHSVNIKKVPSGVCQQQKLHFALLLVVLLISCGSLVKLD